MDTAKPTRGQEGRTIFNSRNSRRHPPRAACFMASTSSSPPRNLRRYLRIVRMVFLGECVTLGGYQDLGQNFFPTEKERERESPMNSPSSRVVVYDYRRVIQFLYNTAHPQHHSKCYTTAKLARIREPQTSVWRGRIHLPALKRICLARTRDRERMRADRTTATCFPQRYVDTNKRERRRWQHKHLLGALLLLLCLVLVVPNRA